MFVMESISCIGLWQWYWNWCVSDVGYNCNFKDWDFRLKDKFMNELFIIHKVCAICLEVSRVSWKTQRVLHLSGHMCRHKIELIYIYNLIFEYLKVCLFSASHGNAEFFTVFSMPSPTISNGDFPLFSKWRFSAMAKMFFSKI